MPQIVKRIILCAFYYLLFYFQTFFANSAKTKCRNYEVKRMQNLTYFSYATGQQIEMKIEANQLNAGSFGQVFIGYTSNSKTPNNPLPKDKCVAIKFYNSQTKNQYENGSRILTELKKFDPNSEHIVKMMDHGSNYPAHPAIYNNANNDGIVDGLWFVSILELGEMSLDQELQRGKNDLSSDQLRHLMKKIMLPLVITHKVSVHLDYKPKNLLLSTRNISFFNSETIPKLIDFDGSILYTHPQKQIAETNVPFMATLLYAAPELLEQYDYEMGAGGLLAAAGKFLVRCISNLAFSKVYTATPKMDIWSAGITMYEIVFSNYLKRNKDNGAVNQGFVDPLITGKLDLVGQLLRVAYMNGKPVSELQALGTKLGLQEATVTPGSNAWWDAYAGVVTNILDIWVGKHGGPDIAVLLGNMLDAVPENRMSAQGVIDYLDGKCRPMHTKTALFGSMEADQLKFIVQNKLQQLENVKTDRNDRHFKLVREMGKKLEAAMKRQKEFLQQLTKRPSFCAH